MRLWSLHPSHLDSKGLVAVWREGLLALHVLRGQTKGYTNHPQLERFKAHPQSVIALSTYLHAIVDEAETRGYNFAREKLEPRQEVELIRITSGQVAYESLHLKKKLQVRDPKRLAKYEEKAFMVHPSFTVVPGEIETWEKVR